MEMRSYTELLEENNALLRDKSKRIQREIKLIRANKRLAEKLEAIKPIDEVEEGSNFALKVAFFTLLFFIIASVYYVLIVGGVVSNPFQL